MSMPGSYDILLFFASIIVTVLYYLVDYAGSNVNLQKLSGGLIARETLFCNFACYGYFRCNCVYVCVNCSLTSLVIMVFPNTGKYVANAANSTGYVLQGALPPYL